jgi:hypothetical protein
MRAWSAFLALALFATPAFADSSPEEQKITVETDTYRFGDLYRSERGTTAEAYAQRCDGEMACAAWSLTPATFRLGPRCELKRTPGTANHRPGAISGMSKVWQMDPDRHGEMRYQTRVPESRQPAAVPLEQLRPSPVPRVFGDSLPQAEPELLGGPTPQASAPAQSLEVVRAPGQGAVPQYVKQPVPAEAHPLYKEPIRQSARPAAQNGVNAVEKPNAQVVVTRPQIDTQPEAPALPAAPARVPWTERDDTAPNYSVGSGFIPGDEDATAGYVEGVPDAGS